MKKDRKFTTNSGIPVENDLTSITAGSRGPVLIQDMHLVEKLASMSQEDRVRATSISHSE